MTASLLSFYIFSVVILISSLMVITSKNPVHSVLFLILSFFNGAGLFIILHAEFLAMILIIVYVGAVAVLFLFVVMMLNITEQLTERSSRKGLINNISVGSVVGIIIFLELLVVIGGWKYKNTFVSLSTINLNLDISNTHALGNILYTDYIHLFQISGMILLIAMIGAITLTFSKRENVKRQSYFDQIQREKDSAVSLIEVESGKGVKLDE